MNESIVILWWGRQIRLLADGQKPAARALEPGEDRVAAILRMIAEAGAAARAVRLIYHPETLEAHEVACPRTSRSRLRRIFAGEHRALAAPDTFWSAEPIRGGPNGHATVIYLDPHSPLPRLREGLAQGGMRLEGAWPLQSLLEAFPTCGDGARGFFSVVAADSQAFVSSLGTSGDRSVRFYDGPEFAAAAIAEMRTVLARFDEGATPPGLLLLEDGPHSAAFRDALRSQPLTEVLPAELLARARFLSPGGFSDFLPRKSFARLRRAARISPKGVIAAAAAMILILMGGHAWSARQDRHRRQREISDQREQRLLSERSAESRRAFQDRIDELDRAESPPQAHYELLTALARTIPPAIALQMLTAGPDRFAIAGHIYEGAGGPENPLSAFYRALAPPEAPWILSPLPPPGPGSDFAIEGSFRGSALAPAPATDSTSARDLAGRLNAVRARLPEARIFDAQARNWNHDWIISTRSVDQFADLEVRHYGLAYDRAHAASWPQIMEDIRTFCAEPGLTIDRLALEANPDGSGDFRQAEINLTVRLLP